MLDQIRNRRGFSLIELVIAMTFITIIIFGVVNLQTSNLAMMSRQNNQIQAHFYANQGVQIVKALGYSKLGCGASCVLIFSDSRKVYSLTSGSKEAIKNTPFERTIKVTTPEGLKQAYKVTSIIEWEDSTGKHTVDEGGHVEAKMIISQ